MRRREKRGGTLRPVFALGIAALSGTLLFPETAGAQGAFQIDTYGNGQFIAEVLNSVAILAGSGLLGLIRLGLVAGILLAVLSSLFGGRMMAGHQFALSILIYMMLFGVRVDMAVYDRVTSYTRVISSVPAGVGVFAWATSGVGSGLTRVMEGAFSLPGALRYSKKRAAPRRRADKAFDLVCGRGASPRKYA